MAENRKPAGLTRKRKLAEAYFAQCDTEERTVSIGGFCRALEITLETLSNMFYISPCYLSRTFKKVSGLPFPRYLNNVRIKEAKRLLRKTKMPVGAVGEAVGYVSNAHFGRAFKSLTGRSPQEYRREHS